jgi:AcrR family transcriptional regulator
MAARSSEVAPRRRGRPACGVDTDTRAELIDAALKLMDEHPWQRVSAKAVADAAGCDPALITYYFGNRQGLVSAAGEQAARTLRGRMSVQYDKEPDVGSALRRAVTDPLEVVVGHPLLAQLYVGELLFRGEQHTDKTLHDMAEPYFEQVLTVAKRAERDGAIRPVAPSVLLYTITSVSLFTSFLGPLPRRGVGGPQSAADATALTNALVDLMLHGVIADGARPRRSRRRTPRPKPGHEEPSTSRRDELVQTAIALLQEHPPEAITPTSLAQVTGFPETTVAQYFPTPYDLMSAVATAASRMVPASGKVRRRGRPITENPLAERELIRAAMDGLAGGGGVSVRAVAARAGCDPALVTYYFGGRRGLMQAVAVRALSDMIAAFSTGRDRSAPLPERLWAALRHPLQMVAEQPTLSELIMDEFLVRGDRQSDAALAAVVRPYLDQIRALVNDGLAEGTLYPAQADELVYAVGVLPFFICAATPLLHRALSASVPATAPGHIAEEVLEVILYGLLTGRRR